MYSHTAIVIVSPFAGERDKPNGFSAVSMISNIFIKLRGIKSLLDSLALLYTTIHNMIFPRFSGHTFASQLVMAGIDITTIKELLGHKTLTMTLRYAYLATSHKIKAVDILDATINEMPTIQKLYKREDVTNE